MEKIDPDLADNPLIFPDRGDPGEHVRLHASDRGPDEAYERKFAEATGG